MTGAARICSICEGWSRSIRAASLIAVLGMSAHAEVVIHGSDPNDPANAWCSEWGPCNDVVEYPSVLYNPNVRLEYECAMQIEYDASGSEIVATTLVCPADCRDGVTLMLQSVSDDAYRHRNFVHYWVAGETGTQRAIICNIEENK